MHPLMRRLATLESRAGVALPETHTVFLQFVGPDPELHIWAQSLDGDRRGQIQRREDETYPQFCARAEAHFVGRPDCARVILTGADS